MGYKNSLDIPAYTEKWGWMPLNTSAAMESRLGLDKARQMADDAAARGILFSVHAPYYISASSLDEEKRLEQRELSAPERGAVQGAGRQEGHLPLRQLRQGEPGSCPGKSAGHPETGAGRAG